MLRNRAMAQLVARLHGVQEAVGSSPTSPTIKNSELPSFCNIGLFNDSRASHSVFDETHR